MAGIGVAYTLLSVFELWEAPPGKACFKIADHAAAGGTRGGHSGPHSVVASRSGTTFHVDLLTFVVFETLFLSICGVFLFGSIVKERKGVRSRNLRRSREMRFERS